VQVTAACPRRCRFCPYDGAGSTAVMPVDRFSVLVDKIAAFAGDAVIGLSLWGELSLHPQKLDLARAVLSRPETSLVIETCGLGWQEAELETLARETAAASPRVSGQPHLSWIVSLDAADLPGGGEAALCAEKLAALFPAPAGQEGGVYVQAIRVKGEETAIEQYYRAWKAKNLGVIIQKYDHFCGRLPDLRAVDISPLERQPCWHLMRDMPILLDGTVPLCREDFDAAAPPGNAFNEPLEEIWRRGEALYREHAAGRYPGLCAACDEYYTYNF